MKAQEQVRHWLNRTREVIRMQNKSLATERDYCGWLRRYFAFTTKLPAGLTSEQKAVSPFFENYWQAYSWGFGMGLVTRRDDVAGVPGRFGWDGAFGTSWWMDPKEQLIGIFLCQRRPDVLGAAPATLDFWTSAYQLIDASSSATAMVDR